ncbi:metal transporter [Herbaspirillum huttiense]|uniref:metal transporter n=1 Tax=Herbaspirillum huttiense TaxID=863372 RepID=UPI0037F7ECCB
MKPNRKPLWLALTAAGIAALAVWGWTSYQTAPSMPAPAAPPASRVSTVGGLTVVTLDEATQKLSGLQTAVLLASTHPAERVAYGSVLDLQPLIDLQTRYRTAAAEVAAAQAAVAASGQEAERNRALFQDDKNVALKSVQAAQAAASADQAKLQAAEASLQAVRASALQQFGARLTRLLAGQDGALTRLLNQQEMLLRIALPLGTASTAPERITVDGGAHGRIVASLMSASPQSDPTAEGPTFLYRAPASLPSGSKVVAYLPSSQQAIPGVVIPESAVLWFGGQPWAYVLQGKDRFVRRPVADQSPYDGGFFVAAGFQPGERVVTRGAQLLLSEEQRPPTSSVAACKDPECDD